MNAVRKGEYLVPNHAPIKRCDSCHAAIIWTATANGSRMPLSVASVRTDEAGAQWALSHFANCPNAKEHRKPSTPDKQTLFGKMVVNLLDLHDYLKRNRLQIQSTSLKEQEGRLVIEAIVKNVGAGSPRPQNEGR